MKRILFAMTVLMLLSFAPISAYAVTLNASTSADQLSTDAMQEEELPDVTFAVSGGMKTDNKTESTFDESRTISGSAEKGTKITISVGVRNADDKLKESCSYELEVGISGLFSQTIDLSLGENVVEITAEKEGFHSVSEEAVIKRKKRDIKTELENGISIPGNNFTVKPSSLSFR